jgi:plasmid maintenance system antidote protein VapI
MSKQETYLEKEIRAAIKASGLTIYRVAKVSGVSQPILCRFVNKKRGITLATASKLTQALGLELTQKKSKKAKRKPRR